MDNKDLNIQNYSISDIFDILEVDNNDFIKAVEMCDEYIEHFDGQSNEVMSNFFLQIKDKLQEYVSDNNINVYNFDDIYETDVSNEDQQNIDVGNLYERLDEFDISGITIEDLKQKIENRKVFYNHLADQSSTDKWTFDYELKKVDQKLLPEYLINNKNKYEEWFD